MYKLTPKFPKTNNTTSKDIFLHLSGNIEQKVKPIGCFKCWYNFAKMWLALIVVGKHAQVKQRRASWRTIPLHQKTFLRRSMFRKHKPKQKLSKKRPFSPQAGIIHILQLRTDGLSITISKQEVTMGWSWRSSASVPWFYHHPANSLQGVSKRMRTIAGKRERNNFLWRALEFLAIEINIPHSNIFHTTFVIDIYQFDHPS